MTARKTSLQIARLRDQGCRVHTILGHWAEQGRYAYGVILPDDIGRSRVAPMSTERVTVFLDRWSSNRIIVETHRPANMLDLNAEVAGVLAEIADGIVKLRQENSAPSPFEVIAEGTATVTVDDVQVALEPVGCTEPCDGTGWTGNPGVRCTTHYEPNDLSEFKW